MRIFTFFSPFWRHRIGAIFATTLLCAGQATAQDTLLISPTGDGGFENGAGFAANGWTVENYSANNTNKWFTGAASTPPAGSSAAYISDNATGATYNYNRYSSSRVMFWRDITFPAGYSTAILSFKIKVTGENKYDDLSVFVQNGGTVPAVTQPSSSASSSPSIPNTTRLHTLSVQGSDYVTKTVAFNAGNDATTTTRRLIFYWENDYTAGSQPPASIDEISVRAYVSNNEASGAVALTINPDANCGVSTNGTTYLASQSVDQAPACSAVAIDDDVWYKFVATSEKHVITYSDVSAGTMAVALYTGTPGNLTPISGNCGDLNGLVAAGLTVGNTYYIRSYTTGTSARATFNICVGVPPAVANDDCATALVVPGFPYTHNQNDGNYASQLSFQSTCSGSMNDGVWYSFTGNGHDIKIALSSIQAMGIYSGTCGALTCITETGTSPYIFNTIPGMTYYINVGHGSNVANNREPVFDITISDEGLAAADNAGNATLLTLGTGCAGTLYHNGLATAGSGEPTASCRWQNAARPVWFKFVAPPSGAVKVSSDNGGTLVANGTRMGVFSVTDSSNYSSFSIIHCNGASGVAEPNSNILYPTGLTPGATYYLVLDVYNASSTGTFCITAEELNSTMLSSTGDCVPGKVYDNVNGSATNPYTGWLSLIDSEGKLTANIRQLAGDASDFTGSSTVKTGTLRTDVNGKQYMNRNFLINDSDGATTNADIQFFFTDAELAEMGVSATALNVTRVAVDNCTADYQDGSGATSLLTQTAHQAFNGVHMIQVNTPGFSNFFIHQGSTPLPIELLSFKGYSSEGANVLQWKTGSEKGIGSFELQRSVDGVDFITLASQAAHGKNNSSYFYTDEHPLKGNNYYRLRMTDGSNKISWSETVLLQAAAISNAILQVYPNPVKDVLKIQANGAISSGAYMELTDLTGRILLTDKVRYPSFTIDMKGLASGTYLLRYTDNGTQTVMKVVKH